MNVSGTEKTDKHTKCLKNCQKTKCYSTRNRHKVYNTIQTCNRLTIISVIKSPTPQKSAYFLTVMPAQQNYVRCYTGIGSVSIQLAQCWFSGLAISNAKI